MPKAKKPIGFGIVGLGNIADFHAQAARALRGGRLHSCFSRSQKKADAFGKKYRALGYSDWNAFLADPELDVVTICTPSGAHLGAALAAAKAKKHVIVEKPLEVTPARCRRIIQACKRNRVKLVTIFPSRFKDVNLAMKDAIGSKRLGKLVNGSACVKWFRDQKYYDSGAWRGTWALDGGGCLMNQSIHNVDLLLWLMGDVTEVMAYADRPSRKRIEVETNLVAALKFANGALGTIEASTEIFPGYPKEIEISGTRGTIAAVEEDLVNWDFEKPLANDKAIRKKFAVKVGGSGGASDPLAISFEGHRRQFQELVDVIRRKKRNLTCDGQEGIRSVKLIDAIYQSVRTGKAVKVR
ncbi:MAG: Gfo/Idh/MocA family oxidoreductase [Verrucomicrobia bacterium]|nr:Gfo/Idh/MocA family oxidoreductase [Verrucomicrobiota bacterium]MDA1085477.1 Gfo/Idh/MocA family oxidoreductase [Verrucomicrobiota bacterium]